MQKNRVGIIIFIFILAFVVLLIRVVAISLFPNPLLTRSAQTAVQRGAILDRNGREIAVTSDVYSFFARTSKLTPEVKDFLVKTFKPYGIFSDQELARLKTSSAFVWIKRRMTSNQQVLVQTVIDELKKAGYIHSDELGILGEDGRFYAYPSASGMVGFVGVDNQGLGGIEYRMNDYLASGCTVRTSIDIDVCNIAYEELKKAVTDNKARYGSVGVLDVQTGEILALVSYPGFDPNDPSALDNGHIKPVFASSIFEPGSVMKQFSAAFALEHDICSPDSPTYLCRGSIDIGDVTIRCGAAHGTVALRDIIQKSCNVGMVQIAKSFDRRDYYNFLTRFGFGKKPDLPITDIESGILRDPAGWSFLSKYMISIGQEIGVTTLQLLVAMSVIGDGGVYRTPVLVRSATDISGKVLYSPPTNTTRVISAATSEQLLSMMQKVVSETGTAIRAQVEGIPIAGKTGTAQVARPGGGGYMDLYNAVFTGYVPANSPRLCIVVAVNEPHGGVHTGGQLAAPVFANIVRRIIISTHYFEDQ